jgi:hypothetical protein
MKFLLRKPFLINGSERMKLFSKHSKRKKFVKLINIMFQHKNRNKLKKLIKIQFQLIKNNKFNKQIFKKNQFKKNLSNKMRILNLKCPLVHRKSLLRNKEKLIRID